MSDLPPRFDRVLADLRLEPTRALVAVSGGSDSLALLDLLARSAVIHRDRLIVAHVDHGIDPASAAVRERVRVAAAGYRLPFRSRRLELGPAATETLARAARYRALQDLEDEAEAGLVFLGHTRDDQVETLVMRFLRGSGPAGLAGMRVRRGPWVRPLLSFSRIELAAHAREAGLEPWSDPANQDPAHLRAWIRHTLLPSIEARLPRFRDDLLAARPDYDDLARGLDELLEPLGLDIRSEPGGGSVAADLLERYSSAGVRVLLRTLGRRFDLALGRAEVDRLQVLLAQGHTGQRVDLGGGAIGELSFGRLRLIREPAHPVSGAVDLAGPSGRLGFGAFEVVWDAGLAPSAPLERVSTVTWIAPAGPLQVRNWQPGDMIRPLRGNGSRLVVRCMQEARVPRSRRPQWPVLVSGGEVVWVPGVCRAETRVPEPDSPAVRVDVRAS